ALLVGLIELQVVAYLLDYLLDGLGDAVHLPDEELMVVGAIFETEDGKIGIELLVADRKHERSIGDSCSCGDLFRRGIPGISRELETANAMRRHPIMVE